MSNYWNSRIQKNLSEAQDAMYKAVNAPIVLNDDEAEQFGKGLAKFVALSADKKAKLMTQSAKAITGDEEEKSADRELLAFIIAVNKALSTQSAVITDTLYQNDVAQRVLSKDLHADMLKDEGARTLNVNIGVRGVGQVYDLGWTQAFNRVSAQDAEKVKLYNLGLVARFLEYKSASDDLEFESFGTHEWAELGRRWFASAFKYAPREMRFSAVSVNEFLTAIRNEATKMLGRLANRAIFDNTDVTSQALSTTFSGATAGSKAAYEQPIYNGRLTLIDARISLFKKANGIERGSKRNRKLGTQNLFPASTPLLLYHNFEHEPHLEQVFYANRGVDVTNPQTPMGIVPISTTDAPYSGQWKSTDLDGARDEMGFFEKVEEGGKAGERGGMLVIPEGRNTVAIFREMSILTDSRVLSEVMEIAAKMEANAAMGADQKMHTFF